MIVFLLETNQMNIKRRKTRYFLTKYYSLMSLINNIYILVQTNFQYNQQKEKETITIQNVKLLHLKKYMHTIYYLTVAL